MMTRSHMYEYRQKPFWVLRIIGWVILGILGAAALAFILGYVVMLLWNWIMPEIFGLTTITFWQSFGIVLLARIIFGSFKHHHEKKDGSPFKKWRRPPYGDSRTRNHEKWKHFDRFWEDEGEKAFNAYINKSDKPEDADRPENDNEKKSDSV